MPQEVAPTSAKPEFDLDQLYRAPAPVHLARTEVRRCHLSHAHLSKKRGLLTDITEVSSIMLIKTLTLHSLTYLVGITSSMAVQQVIPSPGTEARFQSGTGTTATITQQIVNRSIKSGRLPIKQAKPQINDKAPVQVPAQITPNPKFKTDCKPPIDVLGRCFADAGGSADQRPASLRGTERTAPLTITSAAG